MNKKTAFHPKMKGWEDPFASEWLCRKQGFHLFVDGDHRQEWHMDVRVLIILDLRIPFYCCTMDI